MRIASPRGFGVIWCYAAEAFGHAAVSDAMMMGTIIGLEHVLLPEKTFGLGDAGDRLFGTN
jgi:hypothetical protein